MTNTQRAATIALVAAFLAAGLLFQDANAQPDQDANA